MKILAKNNSTGVESPFTEKQWEKIQKDPRYVGTFSLVKKIEEPAEVTERKSQAAAAGKNSGEADKTQDKKQDK